MTVRVAIGAVGCGVRWALSFGAVVRLRLERCIDVWSSEHRQECLCDWEVSGDGLALAGGGAGYGLVGWGGRVVAVG